MVCTWSAVLDIIVKSAFPTQTVCLGAGLDTASPQAEMVSMSIQAISWVLDHSESELGDRLVLISIASCANSDGEDAWPKVPKIARDSRLSERQVYRCLQNLVELGELKIDNGGGRGNRNIYSLPKFTKQLKPDNLSVNPDKMSQETLTSDTQKPDNLSVAIRKNRPEPSNTTVLTLSPPSSEQKETRFAIFKDLLFRFYNWKYQRDPQWDGSEAKQLSALLKSDPKLDAKTFAQWLKNYGESKDICPGERPRIFLPRLSRYSVTALNQYGRSVDVEDEARDGGMDRRSRDAIAEVFGRVPRKNTEIVLAGDHQRRGGDLEKVSRILSFEGD